MAVAIISWLFAIPLLGFATGLRTFIPLAVICWATRIGFLSTQGTWAAWTGNFAITIVVTALAAGELIGDKLPKTPDRTAPMALVARMTLGGLCGAICASAINGPGLEGTLLGIVGAVVGAFAGFMIRREIVQKVGCHDWPVAVVEDLFTIAAACFALHVVNS